MNISVVVADDQELVRTRLRMILDAQAGIEVVGEAENGRQAVAVARELRPDFAESTRVRFRSRSLRH